MNSRTSQALMYALITVAAVSTRLLPHAWNLAPVSAVAVVAALYLPLPAAVALPLVIRFISDAVIGFFSWPLMAAVYASHLFGVLLGRWVRARKTPARVVAAPTAAAILFFLVTNFALFYPASAYPHTWTGIMQAYVNGLPFLRGTLLGDVGYTIALVAGIEAIVYLRARAARRVSGTSVV